jgi:hypothetical protein
MIGDYQKQYFNSLDFTKAFDMFRFIPNLFWLHRIQSDNPNLLIGMFIPFMAYSTKKIFHP